MLNKSFASLGQIMQLGFVPKDYDSEMKRWLALGAGPFFVIDHPPLFEPKYRGKPIELDLTVALANWGEMQIELIRQNNRGPSHYAEWLEAGRQGLNHVCVITDDIGNARIAAEQLGAETVFESGAAGGGQILYVDPPGDAPMVEFLQQSEGRRQLYKAIRDAHISWDGSDPIRPIGR